MQRFELLRQPLMGELAMSPERKRERGEKNAIYSGQLRLCQKPRAVHALRSDQFTQIILFEGALLILPAKVWVAKIHTSRD